MGLLAFVGDLVREHWPAVVFWLVGIALGAWWGRWRAARQWERKEFLNRLNVSLTSIAEGVLRIRTLLEKDAQDVFLNRVAVDKIHQAADHTTEADPLLPLGKDDAWYLLNAVLNELSERFAPGLLRQDMGADVKSARYLICLTYEVAGAVRTRKVRAMVVQRRLLEELPDTMPQLESPSHETRWDTLRALKAAYETRRHLFLEVELAV